ASWSGNAANGTISDSSDTVTVTNTKSATIDVGVIIDSAPFIILLVLALGAVFFFSVRTRKKCEED
ncbi:MAG: hypothetical protein IKG80_03170, partial [Clostridia bacterium]|nr:hypothetical protein [Clostridia bacterium]